MAKAKIEKDEKDEKDEIKYSKSALVFSKRFCDNRDLLSAILDEDIKYSISEVEEKIKNNLEREVK